MDIVREAIGVIVGATLDVLPIVAFLFVFQRFVIGGKIPHLSQIVVGLVFVTIGLGLFLVGLDQTLFPLGRFMAEQLTQPHVLSEAGEASGTLPRWRDYFWVYAFAGAIGFSAALAEPALIAVAIKASLVSGGAIHVLGLRIAVAIGVGIGVGLGCFRIIAGVPLHYFIAVCYLIVIAQTLVAPRLIVPLAYDSGGVTTSTVTVPLVAALGLGLAEAVPGRNALLDGFGLVACACLFPIISVLAYGQLAEWYRRLRSSG